MKEDANRNRSNRYLGKREPLLADRKFRILPFVLRRDRKRYLYFSLGEVSMLFWTLLFTITRNQTFVIAPCFFFLYIFYLICLDYKKLFFCFIWLPRYTYRNLLSCFDFRDLFPEKEKN